MDNKVPQKMFTTCLHQGAIYIESDSRTVWVNEGGRCIARFGKGLREFLMDTRTPEVTKHSEEGPTIQDWNDFVIVVEGYTKGKVDPGHRPKYIRVWNP